MAKPLPIPQLKPDSLVSACLAVIIETRISEIASFKHGVLNGDIEHIHDMRVACRRLQTVLMIFSETIAKSKLVPFKKQLRRLTRRLGAVRQLDVLMEILSGRLQAADDKERTVCNLLFARYSTSRKEAFDKTLNFLIETESAQLFEKFIAAVNISRGGKKKSIRSSVAKSTFAETMRDSIGDLADDFASAVAAARKNDDSIEMLHKMRITGKPLRYAMELAETVYPGGFKDYFQEIKSIIQLVGNVHDIDVAFVSLDSFRKELQSYNEVAGERIDRFPIGFLVDAHEELDVRRNTLLTEIHKILHEWRQDRFFKTFIALIHGIAV